MKITQCISAFKCLHACLLACVYLPFSLPAQEDAIRWIGTNVVDFSRVYQDRRSTRSEWHYKYVAAGRFEKLEDKTLTLLHEVYQFRSDPSVLRSGTKGEIFHMETATRLAGRAGFITIWGYLPLPPQQQRYFFPVDMRIKIKNYDYGPPAVPGITVFVVAWPITENLFDYGKPFRGRLTDAPDILTPSPNGVSSLRASTNLARERQANALVAERNAFERQKLEAMKGSGSAQYELGKRYLFGTGTETNVALAIRWLSASKTNGYQQAAERLLHTITP